MDGYDRQASGGLCLTRTTKRRKALRTLVGRLKIDLFCARGGDQRGSIFVTTHTRPLDADMHRISHLPGLLACPAAHPRHGSCPTLLSARRHCGRTMWAARARGVTKRRLCERRDRRRERGHVGAHSESAAHSPTPFYQIPSSTHTTLCALVCIRKTYDAPSLHHAMPRPCHTSG